MQMGLNNIWNKCSKASIFGPTAELMLRNIFRMFFPVITRTDVYFLFIMLY